jgi:RimJ/RimL family protein N-acetyltransferase
MLQGERVVLRPTHPDDYPALHAWRIDVATWTAMSSSPVWPLTLADFSEFYDRMVRGQEAAEFAIEVAGELVGRCAMFHVDELSRNAEVGMSLGMEHQGKGYGRDALRVLLRYGFGHRNLHRVWLETTATNVAALRSYAAAGMVEEGRLREHAWVDGSYVDVVRMAALRSEWPDRA